MSTSATVGRKEKEKGRYIHDGGQPDRLGKDLITLIRSFGAEDVLKNIVDNYYGWSFIEFGFGDKDYNDNDHEVVDMYGLAYSRSKENDRYRFLDLGANSYTYFISTNGDIEVYYYTELLGTINAYDQDSLEQMKKLKR